MSGGEQGVVAVVLVVVVAVLGLLTGRARAGREEERRRADAESVRADALAGAHRDALEDVDRPAALRGGVLRALDRLRRRRWGGA